MREVHFRSPDGTRVIVDLLDVPKGVARSRTSNAIAYNNYTQGAVDALINEQPWRALEYTGSGDRGYTRGEFVCWVHSADLAKAGWTSAELGVVQGAFTVPSGLARTAAPRAIPDWPLTCPRCGKANSAVTLFSTTDCRWGCFK